MKENLNFAYFIICLVAATSQDQMNQITCDSIITSPYTVKELSHHSRKWLGYHVFLSQHFLQFSALDTKSKEIFLFAKGIWDCCADDTSSNSLDSILTPWYPQCCEIMRLGYIHWILLDWNLKQSWKDRTSALNLRAIPGKFNHLSDIIKTNDICESLSLDLKNLASTFWTCMLQKPKGGESLQEYVFWNKRVLL